MIAFTLHFFRTKGFDIKWVDDTHALGIFSSYIAGGYLNLLQGFRFSCGCFVISVANCYHGGVTGPQKLNFCNAQT